MGDELRHAMWADAIAMMERAERLHRQFFRPDRIGPQRPVWEPPVDVLETGDGFLILCALPGVEAQEVAVAIEADSVTISGTRHWPPVARRAAIHRLEIPYGRFERRVRLPQTLLELSA